MVKQTPDELRELLFDSNGIRIEGPQRKAYEEKKRLEEEEEKKRQAFKELLKEKKKPEEEEKKSRGKDLETVRQLFEEEKKRQEEKKRAGKDLEAVRQLLAAEQELSDIFDEDPFSSTLASPLQPASSPLQPASPLARSMPNLFEREEEKENVAPTDDIVAKAAAAAGLSLSTPDVSLLLPPEEIKEEKGEPSKLTNEPNNPVASTSSASGNAGENEVQIVSLPANLTNFGVLQELHVFSKGVFHHLFHVQNHLHELRNELKNTPQTPQEYITRIGFMLDVLKEIENHANFNGSNVLL